MQEDIPYESYAEKRVRAEIKRIRKLEKYLKKGGLNPQRCHYISAKRCLKRQGKAHLLSLDFVCLLE